MYGINIVPNVNYIRNYLYSSHYHLTHDFSYTKLHSLANTPTGFGAPRPILQGVPCIICRYDEDT